MAGQPQDNSWMQQGQGYSQGAPYQNYQQQPPQPYEQQPPQSYEQQQAPQPYEQPPAYSEQPTIYDQRQLAQPYPGQPGPPQAGPPQAGQAQGQTQNWEQWQLPQEQARPPRAQKQPRKRPSRPASGERGFVASLFDFSFSSFVTPKIIKALYALVAAWTILWAVILLFIGNKQGGVAGLLVVLIIIDPILILVSLGLLRVMLEFFMITFRMQEDLKALRERATETSRPDGP